MKSPLVITTLCLLSASAFAAGTTGADVYERACKTCHAPKLAAALKAPAAFDELAWAKRKLAAKEAVSAPNSPFKKADDYLLHQIKMGKGLMHHGGLCAETATDASKDCTDEALLAAIEYMSKGESPVAATNP